MSSPALLPSTRPLRRRGVFGAPTGAALCLLVLCLLMAGCSDLVYEPSGENPVDPTAVAPDLTLNLNDTRDTIRVWGSLQLVYEATNIGYPVLATRLLIDGQVIQETGGAGGAVMVDTRQFSTGSHSIQLQALVRSGSGSVADAVGIEVIPAQRQWTLVVDNRVPVAVAPTVQVTAAGAVVSWPAYRTFAFQGYDLYRHPDPLQPNQRVLVATITDPNRTSWTDTMFFGPAVGYSYAIRAADKTATSNRVDVSVPTPDLIEATPVGRGVRLRWTRSPFARFGRYRLLRVSALNGESPSIYDGRTIAAFSSADSTTYTDTTQAFGVSYRYQLVIEATDGATLYGATRPTFALGQRIPSFRYSAPVGSQQAVNLLSASSDTTSRLNLQSLTVERTYPAFVSVSPDGNRAATVAPITAQTVLVDPNTFAPLKQLSLRTTLGLQPDSWYQGAPPFLGNEGPLVYNELQFSGVTVYFGRKVAAFDPVTDRTIATMTTPPPGESSVSVQAISSSGRFAIINRAYLYRIDASGFRMVQAAPVPVDNWGMLQFLPTDDLLLRLNPNRLTVFRSEDLTLVSDVALPATLRELHYDPISGLVGGVNEAAGRFEAYRLQSGEQVLSVPVAVGSNVIYRLAGSVLLSNQGWALRLTP